jgi:hypothetical protein
MFSRRSSRPGTPTRRTRAPQARSSSSRLMTARTSFASDAIPPPRTAPNGEPSEDWRLSRDTCARGTICVRPCRRAFRFRSLAFVTHDPRAACPALLRLTLSADGGSHTAVAGQATHGGRKMRREVGLPMAQQDYPNRGRRMLTAAEIHALPDRLIARADSKMMESTPSHRADSQLAAAALRILANEHFYDSVILDKVGDTPSPTANR